AEMDLTTEHVGTLAMIGVLPAESVGVGDIWRIPNAVVQALCGYEGLTEQSLAAKLKGVNGNSANIEISGAASGIELGALVKSSITAVARFDMQTHRLVGLVWKQKDQRDLGPASPASTSESATSLVRS